MVCPASRFGKGAFRASLLLSLTALSVAVAAPLTAIRTRLIPTVDGRLNDPCWASVPPTTGFRVMNTERLAAAQTHAQFVFDGQALYVGIRCAEPNVESIKTRPLPRDNADVFRTDCVEVMLDPTAGRNDYFHLGVNASGTLSDRSCTQGGFVGDMSWDSTARVASFIGADFWSCELAIPFACLAISPQVGSTWRINVCREKRNPTELSSLAEQGAFNIASRFAELTGIDVDFSRYCYAVGAPKAVTRLRDGKLELTLHVPLRDLTGHPGRRLLDGWLLSPSGQVVSVGQTIDFAGKSEQTATLGPLVLEEQGDYASTVRVADPVTKEVLAFRQSRQPIQFIPIAVKLLTPWYRDCIFATQNVTQVIMDIELNLDESARTGSKLLVDIRQAGAAEPLADRTVTPVPETSRVTFPAESLPEGTLEVRARLIDADGQEIALTVKPLRKLPRKSGEIWLGQDLQWYVDGKPFFLNGGWNYAADFVDGYNAFTGERPGEAKLLDTTLMNQGKRMKSLEQKRLSPEDAELVRQHIRTKRDHAALFGYYICDEPECHSTQASALAGVYQVIAEEDPYHPVIISNDSMAGLHDYARCADINGLHPYPPPLRSLAHKDLAPVARFIEGAVAHFTPLSHKQTMAYLHQGFNYGDYGAVNHRIPTYEEYRNQNLLAIICGARGTLQFNRMVAHYPELRIGMPHLTRELAFLGDVLVSPKADIVPQADTDAARLLLKEHKGERWLFVCNAGMAEADISLTVPGMGRSGRVHVVSEARETTVRNGRWTDHFSPFECHIYTSGPTPGLPTVAGIVAEIAAANAARRKPGNLVYQEFEGDGVTVVASSNAAGKYRRPDNGLWHVVDGVVDAADRYSAITWQDTTMNEAPDWLEIRLKEPRMVGRVVVFPFGESLRDYTVQVFAQGQWQDVATVRDQKMDQAEHGFAPVRTDRVRLLVTATNGPIAKVTEVEVYAQ